MITHQSKNKNCTFLFPVLDDAALMIDYNGLLWNAESSKIDSLADFADACSGFSINLFESNDNLFVVIEKKEFSYGEHIELFFESRLQEDFPCAFYDKNDKRYDDFSIPTDAQGISLSVDDDGYLTVISLDYDDEFQGDNEEDDEFDFRTLNGRLDNEPDDTIVSASVDGEIKYIQKPAEESDDKAEKLQERIDELTKMNEHLRVQAQLPVQPAESDESAKAELERLKTLISQIVDNNYDGEYMKTADEQINRLVRQIEEQRKLIQEKAASLARLKMEYTDDEKKKQEIMKEISHTMDLLHKAESIQRESSTELSVFQKRLNDLMNELQIDISTLEMYETKDGIDALLLEANDMKNRMESKLKVLISTRQKDITSRFNNITS